MKKLIAAVVGLVLFAAQGCVGAKVYRAEKTTRVAAEAREKVLVQQLLERKKESIDLTQMVGDLNRLVGRQEVEIKDLQTELVSRTQSMGESAGKLALEKSALEKQFAITSEQLEQRNTVLEQVESVQEKRKAVLNDLELSLSKAFLGQGNIDSCLVTEGETIALTLQDKDIFEPTGLNVSVSGQRWLLTLADFLAARPGLDVDVVAYTDNALPPKEKTIRDTWDWSLQRATNIVRLLVRELNANANQLTPVGRGEYYPLSSNETPEGRAKNRRTVLVFRPVLPAIPGAASDE
jgi:chemotaxis protein MotB